MNSDLINNGSARVRGGYDFPSIRPRRGELTLARGVTHAVYLPADAELWVAVTEGCFWITMEGDALDHAAMPSGPVHLAGPGLVVLEGISATNHLRMTETRLKDFETEPEAA